MNKLFMPVVVFLSLLILNGCSTLTTEKNNHPPQHSPSETILNCIQNKKDTTKSEYKNLLEEAEENLAKNQSKDHYLQMICLNIHPHAGYSQFRKGIRQISHFLELYPHDDSGLSGLENILDQLNRERIVRWNLQIENKDLAEQNTQLQLKADKDQYRLKELKLQIDQLKNIENIIKNRDN